MKRIWICLAVLCLLMGAVSCQNTGGETPAVTTAPTTTEKTTRPSTPQKESVEFTVTVKSEEGVACEDVVITFSQEGEVIETFVTNKQGTATNTLEEGEYEVYVQDYPTGFLPDQSKRNLTVDKDHKSLLIQMEDISPNGTEERPFVFNDTEASYAIPANTTYYFILRGGVNRKLRVEGENFTLTMNGQTYTPEQGAVAVDIITEDSRDMVMFALTNTASAENTLRLVAASKQGTAENPFIMDSLEHDYTAQIADGEIVYYQWTADETGILRVYSENPHNNIALNNLTTSRVSPFTQGKRSEYLAVNEGDVIQVAVATTDTGSDAASLTFALDIYGGAEQNPLQVDPAEIEVNIAPNGDYWIRIMSAGTLTVGGSDVTLSKDGSDIPAVNGVYEVAVEADDILCLTNGKTTDNKVVIELK